MKLERPKTSHPQPEEEAKQEQKTKDWKGDFPHIRLQELDDSPSSLSTIKQSSEHIISYPNIYHIISLISYQGNL